MTESPLDPLSPPFQFRLRTLLLLCVVLGSSLAVFGAWGVLVFGLVVAVAIYVHRFESLSSLTHFAFLVVCLMCLIGLLLSAVPSGCTATRRSECANNLMQIALALHQYEQANGCFPPAYVADNSGKPMHSWRTLILPNLDLSNLYDLFKLSEPWDGPNNKKPRTVPIPIYVCPSDPAVRQPAAVRTSYVAVVGPNTAWAGDKPRKLTDFGKHASTTIMLVEVTNSGIDWAEPKDLSLDSITAADDKSNTPTFTGTHGRREEFFFTYGDGPCINVAMADGSVRTLRLGDRSAEELRKLFEIGGCTEEVLYESARRVNWPNIAALAVWLLSVGTLLIGAVRGRRARVARARSKTP